ncbi:hypothetical protein BGZ52_008074 [Haplosporangium bisporale]|nr:hypothetical protein BGZ52_008074 [Haplosporangium bisporale]
MSTKPKVEPALRGQYELQYIKDIDRWQRSNNQPSNPFWRLLVNIFALFAQWFIMTARLYKSINGILSNLLGFHILWWIEWSLIFVFFANIVHVLWGYARKNNNFEYLPLTPSQRALLGLEPVISNLQGKNPTFGKEASQSVASNHTSLLNTFINQPQGALNKGRSTNTGPAAVAKEAEIILNKSTSRSFNQTSVQDRTDLGRLMRNMEAIDEAHSEWKTTESDPSKRPFALHAGFGAQSTTDLSTGVAGGVVGDVSARPDLATSLASRTAPVGRYHPALRTTLSKDQTSKTDLQKDGVYVVSQSKVMKNLKVTEAQLDRWAYKMRKWMWDHVVSVLVKEMEWVDSELAKEGLSYLDCKSANMFSPTGLERVAPNGTAAPAAAAPAAPAAQTNSLGWGAASIATTRLPSAFGTTLAPAQPQQSQLPATLKDLDARFGTVPYVKQRMVLETYLAIPGCTNRKYVVERITAMGPLLSHFIWDSNGIKWDNGRQNWTADLPTDAQIVMHLFTVFMDLAMPSQTDQSFGRFPFSYKYYATMEAKPDSTTALQIRQSSKVPPHYNLIVDGTIWEVVPKRLNVWYTLVMFIYLVMRESGGYIGQTNIGTKKIGLGDVVEGYNL